MKVNIKDLFDNLNPENYKDVEIKNISMGSPSVEKVKKQVFEKIHGDTTPEKIQFSKKAKNSFRGAWVVAIIIFAIGTTAFGFSRPEYFKWIFGKDTETLEENIQDVVATATDGNIIFTVESLLSDGNQNYFVISLEKKNGEAIGDLVPNVRIELGKSSSKDTMGISSYRTEMIDENISGTSDRKNKAYYLYEMTTGNNLAGNNIDMILYGLRGRDSERGTKLKKELKVSFNIEEHNQNNIKTINVSNSKIIDDRYQVTEIKLSNLGLNLKGKTIGNTNTIPTPNIKLKYKDGNIRDLSYKTSKNTDVDFPDAKHMFSRDGIKNQFTNTITFGELINIDDIESIIVAGEEHSMNK